MKVALAVTTVLVFLCCRVGAQYVRVDPSFSVEMDGPIGNIGLQADGKILIGGSFTTVNGFTRSHFARLNADGTVDYTFAPDNASNSGGQIFVTSSNIYAGTQRYDLNGNLEATYPVGDGYAIDSHRRQLFGRVSEYRLWLRLERFNEDGTQDSTFSPLIDACCLNRGVNAVAIQNDFGQERILIGGKFGDVNG